MAGQNIKKASIPRAGYDYQDLVGIEILIRQYRDPELYEWVLLEADNEDYRALDDVVAARKDGSFELTQVKFTVDSERYELDWNWLLDKKSKKSTSLLEKWAKSYVYISSMGPIHCVGLKTNRKPSADFAKCLEGTRVNLQLVPEETRKIIENVCGGATEANDFFRSFDFWGALPDLNEYEINLRDQLVPTDTDLPGWHTFCHHVRRWATNKNQPEPDGRILREHVVQLISKRRPRPIRQDFSIPDGYSPPDRAFDTLVHNRLEHCDRSITILWGTPGRGKSTYLSHLTHELQEKGEAVIRHHYFISTEDSSYNRSSFIEIASSLLYQLHARHPEIMSGLSDEPDKLRSSIETAANRLASVKKRLYIVIDGLDQVWQDTHRVDQLNHVFNEILPLPPDVNLIIGTQRVSDEQMPSKLLATADDDDWVEIPAMDEVAVHRWLAVQDESRPLIYRYNSEPARHKELLKEIADAFFAISQGHPLHLIYVYEQLIRTGHPTSAEEIRALPSCPDGDIRNYYKRLWVSLCADDKNILHALAGSDFFWPRLGILQVLGDFNHIDHLLDARDTGMVPFHSSLFAWVRERADHAEKYQALLPKISSWLENTAPEYWRWGWLWFVQAQAGEFENLLKGTTRDWVVDSFAKGWPNKQIENILSAAESKAFDIGDLPRTVSLRSLKTRVSNAREYQAGDFAAFFATVLAVTGNRQQTLNVLDDIYNLTDSEVTELARLGPVELLPQVLPTCFNELARRVNAWIVLRHRPDREFIDLSNQFLSLGSLMDKETAQRILHYLRGFKEPEPHVSRFIHLLGNAGNLKGLLFVRQKLRGNKWKDHRRLIHDEIIRAGCLKGAEIRELAPLQEEPLSGFAACWYIWQDHDANVNIYVPPTPKDLARDRYSFDDSEDIILLLCNAFWIAFYVALRSNSSDYSMIHRVLSVSVRNRHDRSAGAGCLEYYPPGFCS